ncbi:MAG TPA: hypothetical protein VI462_01420 [Acidimicrobiia bacterium]
MVKARLIAAGTMLVIPLVAALIASPVNAQTTSGGSSPNGEPHPNIPAPHSQADPMFTQCPAVGVDTGCAILLTIHQDGTVTEQTDLTNQPPYDGTEDTLVGVQNNSNFPVTTLHLTGVATPGAQTFNFMAETPPDGLCSSVPPITPQPGCPFGPTTYEGPHTSFSNISADLASGNVNFDNGLFPATSNPCAPPTGISTYFSLEGALQPSQLSITPLTPPPCATQTAAPAPVVITVEPRFTG